MINLSIILATFLGPNLETDTIVSNPGMLNEIRVEASPPEGYEVAFQRWLIVKGTAHGRSYESNSVFVYTDRAGTVSEVLFEITYVDWDDRKFVTKSRVYTLKFSGKPPPVDPEDPEPEPDTKVTRVSYVYERLNNTVPRPVQAALVELNRRGIVATMVDQNIWTGDDVVPDQYKKALKAAKDKGLPCLVVEFSGGKITTHPNPKTEQDVFKAVE